MIQTGNTQAPQETVHGGLSVLGIIPGVSVVIVIGLGITGFSVIRFLVSRGVEVTVADDREHPPCLSRLNELGSDIPRALGGYDAQAFNGTTHLVVSPGVSLETREIRRALNLGLQLVSDIDLFMSSTSGKVIGITGSNGKSTVTTLLGVMAKEDGRKVKIGGNLGVPALDLLDQGEPTELYVLELSSFQLERTSFLHTDTATVLNISPDHMDRHGDLETYARAKQRIFSKCRVVVINQDDPLVASMGGEDQEVLRFGLKEHQQLDFSVEQRDGTEWIMYRKNPQMPADSVRMRGRHNLSNTLAALALGHAAGLSMASMLKVLRVFPGLPHRMQSVATIDGVDWVNDSKATNIGACIAALEGLPGRTVLIAGGDGKGADFNALKTVVREQARAVVLFGKDAGLLYSILQSETQTLRVANLGQAVETSAHLARPGDTVLLSPACASLDQFPDYQARGRFFEESVRGMMHAH